MIPILYDKNEKAFQHQGLGPLLETVRAHVTEKKNSDFLLELRYPRSGRHAKALKLKRIILAKPNSVDEPHAFRIYDIDRDSSEAYITVYATTITNDLGNNLIKELDIIDMDANSALQEMKKALTFETHFRFASNIDLVKSTYWEHRNPLNALVGESGSIVHLWGGEIKKDNDGIYVYGRRGRDRVTAIRLDKNIDGLEVEESYEDRYTSILPYSDWEEEVYPPGTSAKDEDVTPELVERRTYGTIVYSRYHDKDVPSIRVVNFQPEQDAPPYNTVAKVNNVARNYFTVNNPGVDLPKFTVTADLIQLAESSTYLQVYKGLEQVNLWDTVDAYIPEWDINTQLSISMLKYDVLMERTVRIEAVSLGRNGGGNSAATAIADAYTDMTKKFDEMQQQLINTKNGMNQVVMQAANGKNNLYSGKSEPPPANAKKGDVWFKDMGEGKTAVYIFDGYNWVLQTYDGMEEEIERQINDFNRDLSTKLYIQDAQRQATIDDIYAKVGRNKDDAAEGIKLARAAQSQAANALSNIASSLTEAKNYTNTQLTTARNLINSNLTTIQNNIGNRITTTVNNWNTKFDDVNKKFELYASKTTVDGINRTLTNIDQKVTVAIGDIASKMTKTQVEGLISTKGFQTEGDINRILNNKGYATVTTVESTVRQETNKITQEVVKVESKIPSIDGSRNLWLRSRTMDNNSTFVHGDMPIRYGEPRLKYVRKTRTTQSRVPGYVMRRTDYYWTFQEVIVSFYARTNAPGLNIEVQLVDPSTRSVATSSTGQTNNNSTNPVMVTIANNTWRRYWAKFKLATLPNGKVQGIAVGAFSTNDIPSQYRNSEIYLDIAGIAVYEGALNVAYSEAPEDLEDWNKTVINRLTVTENGILAVNQSIAQTQSSITGFNTRLKIAEGNIEKRITKAQITSELRSTDSDSLGSAVNQLITQKGYLTTSQVDGRVNSVLSGKGYQTQSNVNTLISNALSNGKYMTESATNTLVNNKNYQTASQVQTAINGAGYLTTTQVNNLINTKGFYTQQMINNLLAGKNYVTEANIASAVSNTNSSVYTNINKLITDKGYLTQGRATDLVKQWNQNELGKAINALLTSKGYITDETARLSAGQVYDNKVIETERGMTRKIVQMKTLLSKNLDGRNYAGLTGDPVTFSTTKTDGYNVYKLYETPDKKSLSDMGFAIGDHYMVEFELKWTRTTTVGNFRIEGYTDNSYTHKVLYLGSTTNPGRITKYTGTFRIATAKDLTVNQWRIRVDNSNAAAQVDKFHVHKVHGPIVERDLTHEDSPPTQAWQPAWEDYVTSTKFSYTEDTVDLYRKVLGDTNESGVVTNMAEKIMTTQGFITTVADYSRMTENLLIDSMYHRKTTITGNTTYGSGGFARATHYANNNGSYGYIRANVAAGAAGRPTFNIPIYPDRIPGGTDMMLTFKLYVFSQATTTSGIRIYLRGGSVYSTYVYAPINKQGGPVDVIIPIKTTQPMTFDKNVSTDGLVFQWTGDSSKVVDVEFRDIALRYGTKGLKYTPNPDDAHYIATGELRSEQNATKSEVSNLAGSWAVRNITDRGTILSQLNLNKDGTVKIDGKLIKITGQTSIDNAVIKDAMIDKVSASKITAVNATFANLVAANMNVNNISGLTASFLSAKLDTAIVGLMRGKKITAQNNAMEIDLLSGRLNFNSGGSMVFRHSNNYLAYVGGKSVAFIQPTHRTGVSHAALAMGVRGPTSTSHGGFGLAHIDSNATDGTFAGIKIFRDPGNGTVVDQIDLIADDFRISHSFNSKGFLTIKTTKLSSGFDLIDMLRAFNRNFKALGYEYYNM